MGAYDHQEPRKQKRKVIRDRHSAPQETVSADNIDYRYLQRVINVCIVTGSAIRIGVTRDKTVWAIGVYVDWAEPLTEYVKPGEDINDYLGELAQWIEEGAQTGR